MRDGPAPEDLADEAELRREVASKVPERFRDFFTRPRPFEMRHVTPWSPLEGDQFQPEQSVWFRAVAPVSGGPDMHRAMLAWATDMMLLGTGTRPHGLSWTQPGVQTASLDHAIWFHGDVKVDEWLLYAMDSPWGGRGRGFNRGLIFTQDGRLIASVAQEGLMRKR
jgi:acyl-CoA thioesterase-2